MKFIKRWKIAIEFKIQDAWIGVFWKKSWWGKQLYFVDVWICFIPCVPIHFTYFGSKPDANGKITVPVGVQSTPVKSEAQNA